MSIHRAPAEQSLLPATGLPLPAARGSGVIAYTGGRGLARESLRVGPSFALSDTPEGRRSQGNPLLQTQMWDSKRWRERRNRARGGAANPDNEARYRSEEELSPYLNWLQWLSIVMPSDKLSKSQRGPWGQRMLINLVGSLYKMYANSRDETASLSARRGLMNRDEFIDMCNWEAAPGTELPRADLEAVWIAVRRTQRDSWSLRGREEITLEHWRSLFELEKPEPESVQRIVTYFSEKLERWWSTWEPRFHTDAFQQTRHLGLAQHLPLKWFYNIPDSQLRELATTPMFGQEDRENMDTLLDMWTFAGERGTFASERNRIEQHLLHACLLYVTSAGLFDRLKMPLTYREKKQAMEKMFRESDRLEGITKGEASGDGWPGLGVLPDYQATVAMESIFTLVNTVNRTGCAVYLPHPTLPVILEGFLTCCIDCDTEDCESRAQCVVTYKNFVEWTDFEFDEEAGMMNRFGSVSNLNSGQRPEFNKAVNTRAAPKGTFQRMGDPDMLDEQTKFLFQLQVVHWRTEDEPLRLHEQEYDEELQDITTEARNFLYRRDGKEKIFGLPYKPRVPKSDAKKRLLDRVYEADYERRHEQRVLSTAEREAQGLPYLSLAQRDHQRKQRSDAHREYLAREFADRRAPDTYLSSSAGLQWKMANYKEAPLCLTVPGRGIDAHGDPVRIPFAEFLLEQRFFDDYAATPSGWPPPSWSAGMLISASDLVGVHPEGGRARDRYLVADLYDLYPDGPEGRRPFSVPDDPFPEPDDSLGGEEDTKAKFLKTSEFAPWSPEAETEAAAAAATPRPSADGPTAFEQQLAATPGDAFSHLGQCNVFFGGGTAANASGDPKDEFAYLIDRPYPADDRPPAIPTDPMSALKMCRAAQTAPRSQAPPDIAEYRMLKQYGILDQRRQLQRELTGLDDASSSQLSSEEREAKRVSLKSELSRLDLVEKDLLDATRSERQSLASAVDSVLKFRLTSRTPFHNSRLDTVLSGVVIDAEPLGVPANAVKTWRWPATDHSEITKWTDVLPVQNRSGQLTMIRAAQSDGRCPLDRMRDFMLYPSLYLTQPKRVHEFATQSL